MTVQHHLSLFPASRTVIELQQNLYVDDFLSGCDFVEETCLMIHEACDRLYDIDQMEFQPAWGNGDCHSECTLQHYGLISSPRLGYSTGDLARCWVNIYDLKLSWNFNATPYTMNRNYKNKMDLLKASVSHIEYL